MPPEEIEQILTILAQKLGPMATKVWIIYVRQAHISLVQNILMGLILGFVGFILWRSAKYCHQRATEERKTKQDRRGDPGEGWEMGRFFALGFAVGAGLLGLAIVTINVLNLFNVEYIAIKLLLR